MSSSITTMLMIVLGIIAVAVVAVVIYAQLGSAGDNIDGDGNVKIPAAEIKAEYICKNADYKWDATAKTCAE